MQVQITRNKGFINHDMSIEGVSAIQYRADIYNSSGAKYATTSHHVLPNLMREVARLTNELDKHERGIT
jgi:hypothetical protein